MSINAQGSKFALALQYAKFRDGYTEPRKATGKIAFSAMPDITDTVTIGGEVYAFKSTMTTANDVQIVSGDLRATMQNLVDAINNGPIRGTDYHSDTDPALVATAELSSSENIIIITAYIFGVGGNSIAFSKVDADNDMVLTPNAGFLAGGVKGGEALKATGRLGFKGNPADADTVVIGAVTYRFKDTMALANDVKRETTLDGTQAHLLATINGTGVSGTDFFAGTVSPDAVARAAENSTDVFILTAITAGAAGNAINLAITGTQMVVSGATFLGGADAKLYDRTTLTWREFRATDIDYDAMQQQAVFPLETGGPLTPTGAYKGAVFAAGGFGFLPRMLDNLGYLLLALMGKCVTVDQGAYGTHTFTYAANEGELPWVAARRAIPGRDAVLGEGLLVFDNILANMRLTASPATPLDARVDLMGRVPELDHHPELWSSIGEDFKSVPVACRGYFKVPEVFGTKTVPTPSVIVDISNATTGPREELIIGYFYLDDIIALTRAITIRWTHKWDSPDLYQRAFGGLGNTAWLPEPFTTKTIGSDFAFELKLEAPFNIPNTNVPYSIMIRGNEAFWQPQGGARLRPGNLVMMDWMMTTLYNPSGYAEIVLTNGNQVGYAIPSEP